MNTISVFNFNRMQKITNHPKAVPFRATTSFVESNPCNCKMDSRCNCNYFCPSRKINFEQIGKMNIRNLAFVNESGVRGETLSSKRNRKYLCALKQCGIENIIDLREKYASAIYSELCTCARLKYFNIPIDSCGISDDEIIKNMPMLINLINRGNFYISCAQGLHRTDIALAINYVFNPKKSKTPPTMQGHLRDKGFKSEDIVRRLNSIKKRVTPQDLKKMGWIEPDIFEQEFTLRKNELIAFNRLNASAISNQA